MTTTTALTSSVRMVNNAPALIINGQPHTGLMFWHSKMHEAGPDLRLFAEAGVQLVTGGFGVRYDNGESALDYRHIDAMMDAILSAHPHALVLPRVGLEPPGWWAQAYPEEMDLHHDAVNNDPVHYRVSFSSRPWRVDGAEALRAFIRYCEAHYADHIFGYHLCAGDCGEWAYAWRPVLGEFSPAQVRGFRQWLRGQYADVDALRAAWDDDAVDFDTAAIPLEERKRPTGVWPRPWSLYDPARERRCIDYMRYSSEVVADAIVHFCGTAKDELAALGREKVCGVFYGYHLVNLRIPYALQGSGHHALEPVLASPHVDFLCAPLNYQERQAGGYYLSQLLPGSLRLRGKLFYDEDDTFTHLAGYTPWRYLCPDAETTVQVLRRNLAGALADGGTHWWMDHDGAGWYRDDAVMAEVARQAQLGAEVLDRDRTPAAQVAVVVSDASMAYFRHDSALTDALLTWQMGEVNALGAPHIALRAAELPHLAEQPWSEQIRLLLFLDCVELTEAERAAIARLAGDGRTLAWVYAAGLAAGGRFDPDAQATATGIRVKLEERSGPLMVDTCLTGTRLRYGTDREVAPILTGDDPDADVVGWEAHRGAPGLLTRDMGGWRSVWSAAPCLPAALLRHLAADAGAHIYTDTGDQVMAAGDLLALHAASSGPRDIRLPRTATVHDAYTGVVMAEEAERFTVEMQRGETVIWRLR